LGLATSDDNKSLPQNEGFVPMNGSFITRTSLGFFLEVAQRRELPGDHQHPRVCGGFFTAKGETWLRTTMRRMEQVSQGATRGNRTRGKRIDDLDRKIIIARGRSTACRVCNSSHPKHLGDRRLATSSARTTTPVIAFPRASEPPLRAC